MSNQGLSEFISRISRSRTFLSKNTGQQSKILEALTILHELGLPVEEKSSRAAESMALAFLAVANIDESASWKQASSIKNHSLLTREIIEWVNSRYNESRSSGSYDDVRRRDLLWPRLAEFVVNSGGATNAPNRRFGLSPAFQEIVRKYGTPQWNQARDEFIKTNPALRELLSAPRRQTLTPVNLPQGIEVGLGPGEHNNLIRATIEDFLPRYGNYAEVLYVGDADDRDLYKNDMKLADLGVFELAAEELPDVVAYSETKNWLFLIEAVHSTGPVSREKHLRYQQLLSNCVAQVIYVTAFASRNSFRRFAADIAWETEVWIADEPSHMIHYNGDKFLGPHVHE